MKTRARRLVRNLPTGGNVPPCHAFASFNGFLAGVEKLRQWDDQDMWVGECATCGSTIAWVIHPTRFDENDEGPEERAARRDAALEAGGVVENPQLGVHPDLFKKQGERRGAGGRFKKRPPADTPMFVALESLSAEQILELPRAAFTESEWEQLDDEVRDEIMSHEETPLENMILEDPFDDHRWDCLPGAVQRRLATGWTRDAIDVEVWEGLPKDLRELIHEHEPRSLARIDRLVAYFVDRYNSTINDPDYSYVLESAREDLSSFLHENADHLVDRAVRNGNEGHVDEIVDDFMAKGFTKKQVTDAIDEALQDTDNYIDEPSDNGSGSFYTGSANVGSLYIEHHTYKDALVDMYDDEIEAAIEKINTETDNAFDARYRSSNSFTVENVKRPTFSVERDIDAYSYVDFEPDWDQIASAVEKILANIEPEDLEAASALADTALSRRSQSEGMRRVWTFPDGFYWFELTPEDMVAEGAHWVCKTHGPTYDVSVNYEDRTAICQECDRAGVSAAVLPNEDSLKHCIGDPQYEYPQTVERGAGRAFSLRRPSGKRLLSLFADLNLRGEITDISQVKGKANRLVGWDLSKAGVGKLKEDEVIKTILFIRDYLKFNPLKVGDLEPALSYLGKHSTKWFEANLGPWEGPRDLPKPNPPVGDDDFEELCHGCGGPAVGFCAPRR